MLENTAVTVYPNMKFECSTMPEANGILDSHHHEVGNLGGSHSGSSGRSTPSGQNGSGTDQSPGKLFVGGLSWQTSEEKLREYFMMFGKVTDVLIMKDSNTQRSRGFGFITFADPSGVENVLKAPVHTLDGKKIDPKHATPKNRPKQPAKTKKVFVGGVSQDTSGEEVKAYFSQFGKVEETVMLMDQTTKRHRGFGFVTFEFEDVVDRVCEIHFHTIKNKKVECKKAQPKEAVQSNPQLLGKRLMLGQLGVRLPAPVAAVNPLAAIQPLAHVQAQAAAAAAAAAQAQSAAVANYGKLLYPHLASYRYSPYSIPTMNAPAPTAAPPNPAAGPGGAQAPGGATALGPVPQVAANPYQGYNLANVDMNGFQGLDWYGLSMYLQ